MSGGHRRQTDWPAPTDQPIVDYPRHWADGIHDGDGHALWSSPLNTDGESLLLVELSAFMCQNGFEYACDDVSKIALDPARVRQTRELETKWFADMGVYTRVPRANQVRRKGR